MKKNATVFYLAIALFLFFFHTLGQSKAESLDSYQVSFINLKKSFNSSIIAVGSIWATRGLAASLQARRQQFFTVNVAHIVNDAVFTTNMRGWAIADNKLFQSIDGGASWTLVGGFEGKRFNRVSFSSEAVGLIAGQQGSVYITRDAGLSWKARDCATEFEITEIFTVGENHIWLRSNAQELFLSSDGGETWQKNPTYYAISKLFFINPKEGWAVDISGNIIRSSDGGFSWSINREKEADTLRDVFFLNKNEGWVSGNTVLKTQNGGKTWKPLARISVPFSNIVFLNRKQGWALGDDFNLYYSNNGGRSWAMPNEKWKKDIADETYNSIFRHKL